MATEKGGLEPKLTTTEMAGRVLGSHLSPGQMPGKTSISLSTAQLLAQCADSRVLITDVDSQRSAGEYSAQAYTPIILDCPPSSGYPVGGPVWEETLRTMGLDAGDGQPR
ncbi:ParA family protein [Streptomyces erythrochromogenes]|uniref:ParA family protein n=1 Tax=Streptomyces erythrochromogenes TaxID=285574 RepID=UPI003418766B